MTDTKRSAGWYWDQYWSADRAASCFEGPQSNYENSIRKHWEDFFITLPRNCDILDVGTGNGAVPAIGTHISAEHDRHFNITGVDQANIDPQLHLKRDAMSIHGVNFLGNTSASALPFEDGKFGAVTSQFALEYMALSAVLPELRRVAAAGAQLQCVVHAGDGVASSGAQRELQHCAYLLKESGIFEKSRDSMSWVVKLERSSTPVQEQDDIRARQLIHDFEAALHDLAQRRKHFGAHPMLDNVQQALTHLYQNRRSYSAEQLMQHVGTVQSEVEAHAARLHELRSASRDDAGIEQLADQIADAGFSRPEPKALLRQDGDIQLGWLLHCVAQ